MGTSSRAMHAWRSAAAASLTLASAVAPVGTVTIVDNTNRIPTLAATSSSDDSGMPLMARAYFDMVAALSSVTAQASVKALSASAKASVRPLMFTLWIANPISC